jgi:undecaprenyl diphosphate synthase
MAHVLTAQPDSSAAGLLLRALQADVPRHVAIIMDGNGRWGQLHGKDRCDGHAYGVESIRRTVEAAQDLKVDYVSLYSFSTENMTRPLDEVNFLFDLFARTLDHEIPALNAKNVRIVVTGLIDWLPEELADKFRYGVAQTEHNDGLTLNLCVMYSGRAELLDATRLAMKLAQSGELDPDRLTERVYRELLYQPEIPDPDVVVRTSGEQRISNFLLWQIAYSELVFTEVLWPDFGKADFYAAVLEYQQRHRRFGAI